MRFLIHRGSLCAGVSSDHPGPTLDVDGGAVVPVENETTGRHTCSLLSEAFWNKQSAPGASLCGFARLDEDERLTGSFGLVCRESYKRVPSRIRDSLGEPVVADHVANPHLLKGETVVGVNEFAGSLVQEVPAAVRHLLVLASNLTTLLAVVGRTFLLTRQLTLLPLEPLLAARLVRTAR
jgi:hypothetical protein